VAIVVGVMTAAAFTGFTALPLGFVGVPIAGLVGAWLAPRLDLTTGRPVATIIAMAATCTVVGAYAIGLFAGVYSPVLGTMGLLLFGTPVFVLLLLPAAVWAGGVRFLARRGWT
jgi:hypothetical protein